MKQTKWRIGWYSKIILTVIAVSLVGLLVRQLPEKVEAKPESMVRVKVLSTDYSKLHRGLKIRLDVEEQEAIQIIDPDERKLAEMALEAPSVSCEVILGRVLTYEYAQGYRVKFATDDFIILESG